jgi:hypothetical protein
MFEISSKLTFSRFFTIHSHEQCCGCTRNTHRVDQIEFTARHPWHSQSRWAANASNAAMWLADGRDVRRAARASARVTRRGCAKSTADGCHRRSSAPASCAWHVSHTRHDHTPSTLTVAAHGDNTFVSSSRKYRHSCNSLFDNVTTQQDIHAHRMGSINILTTARSMSANE